MHGKTLRLHVQDNVVLLCGSIQTHVFRVHTWNGVKSSMSFEYFYPIWITRSHHADDRDV
jgi:hypothetical protein